MPNPKIKPQNWDASPPDRGARIGMLDRVPGQYWAQGSDGLTPAGPDVQSPQDAEIDVPGIGRVRIRYRTVHYKRGKASHWGWLAEWGDLVGD